MITVLIADIDVENIKHFRTYIKNNYSEIRVIGTVSSFSDFNDKVRTLKPNLILADIYFFGFSSVHSLREIYEKYPETRFVLYGTYNYLEYIERVLEFGVIDYMFHPVKPPELDRCLKNAMKVFQDMRSVQVAEEQLGDAYQNDMGLFYDKFIQNWLQGHITNEYELESSLRYFQVSLRPAYTVCIVRIDQFKQVIMTLDEREKHLLVYKLWVFIREKLKNIGEGTAVINRFNSVSIILGGSMGFDEIVKFCEILKTEIRHQIKRSVTIGIGRTYDRLSDVSVSYYEADAALRYRHYVGYYSVIPIHFVEPFNEISYKYPNEKEDMLIHSAVTGEYEYCVTLWRQIIDRLKEIDTFPERLIPKIIMSIIISISRYATEQQILVENLFTQFFSSREIFELKTLDDAYLYLNEALKCFCDYMVEIRNHNNDIILERAKEYINEKYYESFSLPNVAIHAGTTPEFLSHLFKDVLSMNLFEYTVQIRIAKAKELMRETIAEDELIGMQIGYDDVKHFRSVFKQQEGLTTFEYRMKHR